MRGNTSHRPEVIIEQAMVAIRRRQSRRALGRQAESDHAPAVSIAVTEVLDIVEHNGDLGRPTTVTDLGRTLGIDQPRASKLAGQAIAAGLLHSAHDCAEGGIAIAIAESCLLGDIGAWVGIEELGQDAGLNTAAAGILFGESQSRFVISFAREALVRLHELAGRHSVPFRGLGSVGGERVGVTGCIDVSLADVRRVHEGALIERE